MHQELGVGKDLEAIEAILNLETDFYNTRVTFLPPALEGILSSSYEKISQGTAKIAMQPKLAYSSPFFLHNINLFNLYGGF